MIDADGGSTPITSLFRTTVRETDTAESENSPDATVLYGFLARSPSTTLVARWNSNRITVCRGGPVTREQMAAAGWMR
jgi:hypothetical protein